jgi:hypothetical protein
MCPDCIKLQQRMFLRLVRMMRDAHAEVQLMMMKVASAGGDEVSAERQTRHGELGGVAPTPIKAAKC